MTPRVGYAHRGHSHPGARDLSLAIYLSIYIYLSVYLYTCNRLSGWWFSTVGSLDAVVVTFPFPLHLWKAEVAMCITSCALADPIAACCSAVQFNADLRPYKPYGLLGMEPRMSTSTFIQLLSSVRDRSVQCCFEST